MEDEIERKAGRAGSAPVAHDDAVEAPFLPEDALEKSRILGAMHAVNSPVSNIGALASTKAESDIYQRGHVGPRLRLLLSQHEAAMYVSNVHRTGQSCSRAHGYR